MKIMKRILVLVLALAMLLGPALIREVRADESTAFGTAGPGWSRSDEALSTGMADVSSNEICSASGSARATSVSPRISHWNAITDMGAPCTYIGSGEWGFLCYELYDGTTGALLSEVVDYSCQVTLTIYYPDGTVAHSYTFTNEDTGWVALKANTVGTYTYTITLSGDLSGTYNGSYTVFNTDTNVLRLAGDNRYETAILAAEELLAERKAQQGSAKAKFDTIIVASGTSFPDALSGSYLASVKGAPILLSGSDTYNEITKAYIRQNLESGGTVYILGGTSAVPASMETGLDDFRVKRLAGDNRFDTNLAILKEAGVRNQEILVCTGYNFADSLSASATGRPILLVNNGTGKLTQNQKNYLAGLNGNSFCIIGGESAVSKNLANAIKTYGSVTRLSGANRYETSVLVAQRYFSTPTQVVLAYAQNYPDGLCGGALASAMGVPLILTKTGSETQASKYVRGLGISGGVVLGGDKLISADALNKIFVVVSGAKIIWR